MGRDQHNINQKTSVSLVIRNAKILTGDRRSPFFFPGGIAIDGDKIVDVNSDEIIARKYVGASEIDANSNIVHPGFIEPHLHLISAVFHGFPMDRLKSNKKCISYGEIKTESRDEQAVEVFSKAVAVSFLRRGFTCFAEAGTVFATIAMREALESIGIRAMISAPFLWDEPDTVVERFYGDQAKKLIQLAPASLQRVARAVEEESVRDQAGGGLVKSFVCLFGEGTGSDELLRFASAFAAERNTVFNQHQNYSATFAALERESRGESGLQRLRKLGILGENVTLTHLNHLDGADLEIASTSKVKVVWCPSNSMLRSIFPSSPCLHPLLMDKGSVVSLGMDTVQLQPLGSAGAAAMLLAGASGQDFDADHTFYMQTINAASCIGIENMCGSITAGKKADIVVRKSWDISHSVYKRQFGALGISAPQIPVDTVIIDGKVILGNGEVLGLDERQLSENACAHRDKLIRKAMDRRRS